jgi:hypothetical protein
MITENEISVHREQFSSGLNIMAKIKTYLTEKKSILKIWYLFIFQVSTG